MGPDNKPAGLTTRDETWRWIAAAILALAAVLFFARLGTRALWSFEFRWAEIAREMRVNSNYFWPTINGSVYYDKPLLSYWFVVWASWLLGAVNELAARLPSAVAGMLGVLFLMILVRDLYGIRSAVLSAFILATSFSFVFFSRHASADVETVTGVLAALLLFRRHEKQQGGWWVVGLWLIMAVTSLTKGLLGFALPLVVIGTYSCLADGCAELYRGLLRGSLSQRARWFGEHNRWLLTPKTIVAVLLGAGIYIWPFLVSAAQTGSQRGLFMVYRENLLRFFRPFDHRGPVYLYVYVVFALMAPWSALLPAALLHMHRKLAEGSQTERSDRFALAYFWATFLFYTLSGSRRSYYILPILPAGATIVAQLLTSPDVSLSVAVRRLLYAGYGLVVIVVVLAGFAMLPARYILPWPWAALPPLPYRAVYAIFWVVGLAGAAHALSGFSARRAAVSLGTIAYLGLAYIYMFAMPAADAWRGEKAFGLNVKKIIGPALPQLAVFKTLGPLFYLDPPKPLPMYRDPEALANAVAERRVMWVVVKLRDRTALKIPNRILASEAVYPWQDGTHLENRLVLVSVGEKREIGSNSAPNPAW